MQELFVGVSEVAERLGVSSDTVTRWCRQGRIPGIKPGRDWRVPASVAEDLLAGRPARFWTADLEPQLARLHASDHVLVLVPGGVKEARAFRSVLLEMGKGTATPEPPAPPVGKLFAQAMLRGVRLPSHSLRPPSRRSGSSAGWAASAPRPSPPKAASPGQPRTPAG